MAFCKQCGAQLIEGSRFCTTCGAEAPVAAEPVISVSEEQPKAEPQPAYQPPAYTQPSYTAERRAPAKQNASNAGGYQSAYQQPGQQAYGGYNQPQHPPVAPQSPVMSTGQFLGTLLLMMIPIAGFILTIVWACGGTDNLNRRNLARAKLILIAIGIVLCILLSVLFSALALSFANQMDGLQWEFNRDFGDDFGDFDDFADGFSDGFNQNFSFQSFEVGGCTLALL